MALTCLGAFVLSSCYVARFFYWNYADVRDYKKFPAIPVKNDPSGRFFFHQKLKEDLFKQLDYDNTTIDLCDLLSNPKTKTLAFLVIRNDTILYENYWFGYDQSSVIPSFSIAKSFTAALVGIALDEGHINSLEQPVTDFLPRLKETDSRYEKITLRHLLDMRSGIEFDENSYRNPFAEISRLYYTKNIPNQIYNTRVDTTPGLSYNYQSINAQLLGMVLENVTRMDPAQYLEAKIWIPLGMEYPASWSIDSKKNRTVKAYCCLNARPRDFAKFSRLFLKKGSWQGQRVIAESWVESSLKWTSGISGYQNHWYIVRTRAHPGQNMVALGHLGQYLYLDPAEKVIIVRMGKGQGNVNWMRLFDVLLERLLS